MQKQHSSSTGVMWQIADEGWPVLALAGFITILLTIIYTPLGTFALGLIVWLAHILRVPHRQSPDDDDAILAPADGRVIDQLGTLVEQIKTSPDSRRLIVSAWNPADVPDMALPPCHCLFQFFVADGKLSCQLYQRSADIFLGVPFNIASYALLTHMIAHVTGLQPGEFVHVLGDAHLYDNHTEQAREQLQRTPGPLPRLRLIDPPDRLEDFRFEHFAIDDYQAAPNIKAPIAV